MTDLPKALKVAVIENELSGLMQAQYMLEVRHRVNKKLGASADELKNITDQLVKVASQIELYQEEKERLENETN